MQVFLLLTLNLYILGFGGWHMGNQSQDEVFLAAQEAVGAHRDSQGRIYDPLQSTPFPKCNKCSNVYISNLYKIGGFHYAFISVNLLDTLIKL